MTRRAAVVAAVTFLSRALAAEPSPAEGDPQEAAGDRVLAGGAAVVPGAVVHGAGHFVLGEKRTAGRLLIAEGVGLGMVLAGGGTLFATGASRYVVGPAAAVTVLGLGLFATSFLADVYGTLSPDAAAAGARLSVPPLVEAAVGYRYVSDPQFPYRHFVVESLELRKGPVRLAPSGWFGTGGDSARYRLEAAYRLTGPRPDRPRVAGTYVDVVTAGGHQRYAPFGFTIWGAELGVDTRYDLGAVGPTLRGAFVQGSVGYAHQWIEYKLPGLDVPTDSEMLLLSRFAFGAVLRGAAAPGSEATLYYDHRRDTYAGGLLARGLGSGVPGHLGLSGRWYFGRSLGVLAEAQVGSALVGGASLLVREGGNP